MKPRVGAESIEERISPERMDPFVVPVNRTLHPDEGVVDLAQAEANPSKTRR